MMVLSVDDLRDSLTPRDMVVLSDIDRFRLLSTRQIQRLHFATDHANSQAATRATHRALRRMESYAVLQRLQRRIGGAQRGSAGSLWQLGTRGVTVLQNPTDATKRRRTQEPSSGVFVRHTVAVAEAAVAIVEATRSHRLELLSLQPEPQSWRQFLGQHGQPDWLRPDLHVVVANSDFEQHTFIEVDQGTEHSPQLLRKCHVYARFAAVGAAEHTTGVIPRVLWVVPDTARQEAIARVIAREASLPQEMFTVVVSTHAASQVMAGLVKPEPG